MKIKKFSNILNENKSDMDVLGTMKKAVDAYRYIDEVGAEIAGVCMEQIQPLLDENKFSEAKRMARKFYEPSRYKEDESSEYEGGVIFIEYDMIMAKINRLKSEHAKK